MGCFFIELFIKVFVNRKKFFKCLLNFIDLLIFFLNIAVLVYISSANVDIFTYNIESQPYFLIRSFQVVRIFWLLTAKKLWTSIAILMEEIIKILKELKDFLFLILVYLVFISLVSGDLFDYKKFDINSLDFSLRIDVIRMNFLSFSRAFFANIIIFFNEDWNITMITHMKAYKNQAISVFFVINVLISAIIMNKIFLAMLINKLIESKNMKSLISKENFFVFLFNKIKNLLISKSNNHENMMASSPKLSIIKNKKHSRFFSKIKKLARKLVNFSSNFDKFMFITCCFSLILIALYDPFKSPYSTYNLLLKYLDIPVFVIFVCEIVLLIISEEKKIINFRILFRVFICIIYLAYFFSDIKILKLLVTFRFIFIINFYESLNLAAKALLYSLFDIFQLFVFYFLFIILFGTIGVQLYRNMFWSCHNISEEILLVIKDKYDCLDSGGDWLNADFNFDNILKAINFLFAVANSSGWLPLM